VQTISKRDLLSSLEAVAILTAPHRSNLSARHFNYERRNNQEMHAKSISLTNHFCGPFTLSKACQSCIFNIFLDRHRPIVSYLPYLAGS
jgi:hypothetical protein